MKDHKDHGLSDEDGPVDKDCECRNTDEEPNCAEAGCGFCIASGMAKEHEKYPNDGWSGR